MSVGQLKKLKKRKGWWAFLIAAIVCWTLLGRADGDRYSVSYGGDQLTVRWLADYMQDNTQPPVYTTEEEGSVIVHRLYRDIPALSLKAGRYRIFISYSGTDDSSVLKLFATDYTSPDNSGGKVFLYQPLDSSQTYFMTEFETDQDVNGVYFHIETKDPAFSLHSLSMESLAPMYSDTLYYCVLTALAALACFVLCNARFARVAPGTLEHIHGERAVIVPPANVVLCSVLIGAGTVLIASLPLLRIGFPPGGIDLFFHTARIEELAAGLASGQFPVRIHGDLLNHYGYPNSYFYPDLLLYFPAVLSLLGVHTITCYKFLIVFVHVLTLVCAYVPFKRLLRSRKLAMALAVVYLLNPYRLSCAYYRSAIGELNAITFLPLVLYGLYAILAGDTRDWPFLVAGATGLIQSHILTTDLTALLCAVIILSCLRQLFTPERRILPLVTAGIYTVLLNAWFLIPMLLVSVTIQPQVFAHSQNASLFALSDLGLLFTTVSPNIRCPTVIGWVELFGVAFYLLYRFAFSTQMQRLPGLRFTDILAAVCIGASLSVTVCFPWERLPEIPILGPLLDVIQFPYRLMILVNVCAVILSGCAILLWLKKSAHRMLACVCMVSLSVFTTCLLCEFAFSYSTNPKYQYNNNMNNLLPVGLFEYLAAGANLDGILDSSPAIRSENPSLTVSGWERSGTNMRFDYRISPDPDPDADDRIVLPLTYIPNYDVRVNGQKVTLSRTLMAEVAFEPPCAEGTVTVRYSEPKTFRLCEAVSVLTLLVLLLRKRLAAALKNRFAGRFPARGIPANGAKYCAGFRGSGEVRKPAPERKENQWND